MVEFKNNEGHKGKSERGEWGRFCPGVPVHKGITIVLSLLGVIG